MRGKERQTTASRRQRVLELLAQGATPGQVDGRLGLSERTIRHYLADSATKARLRQLQDERLAALARRVLTGAEAALATLLALLERQDLPPQSKIAAGRTVLEVALRLVEAADLAERVAAVEALVQQERGGRRGPMA